MAARAANAVYGAEAMRASRDRLRDEHGDQRFFLFMADRAEYRVRKGSDGYLWDVQGYYGGDAEKLFYKGKGEGNFEEPIERAELQALWSHAIGPWFDLHAAFGNGGSEQCRFCPRSGRGAQHHQLGC